MAVGAVIVGAGTSRRAGFDKVFANLAGRPVLAHSVEAFSACAAVDAIVLVLSSANIARGLAMVKAQGWAKVVAVRPGGARRQDSVTAGLDALAGFDWVAVHDAARPLVTTDLIERGLAAAEPTGAAIAAVPVVDTIKVVSDDMLVESTPSRSNLWAVQTPQIFRLGTIRAAYAEAKGEFTDDAAVLERRGDEVRVYHGSPDNIKITLPGDLELAEFLLERRKWRGSA